MKKKFKQFVEWTHLLTNVLELDMTDLESGLYLISLDISESKTIFRIMKE